MQEAGLSAGLDQDWMVRNISGDAALVVVGYPKGQGDALTRLAGGTNEKAPGREARGFV